MECIDAMRLLLERRSAASKGDLERVERIDSERWRHDPDGGHICDCWASAIRIMDEAERIAA